MMAMHMWMIGRLILGKNTPLFKMLQTHVNRLVSEKHNSDLHIFKIRFLEYVLLYQYPPLPLGVGKPREILFYAQDMNLDVLGIILLYSCKVGTYCFSAFSSQGWPNNIKWNPILHRQQFVFLCFSAAVVEDGWCDLDLSASYWSCGISVLLASQSTAPPFSLLSLPFPPSFLHRHWAHNM